MTPPWTPEQVEGVRRELFDWHFGPDRNAALDALDELADRMAFGESGRGEGGTVGCHLDGPDPAGHQP